LIKKENIIVGVVAALIVLPAALSLSAYFITKNPNFRPLGITIDKLAEAGLISDSGEIIAVVSIGDKSVTHTSKGEYTKALESTFDILGTEVRVKFRTVPNTSDVSVTYLVGQSKIGPYPISQAANGVKAAVRAERMVKAHLRKLATEQEKKFGENSSSSWFRFFDG
jgi:hypothetical protein